MADQTSLQAIGQSARATGAGPSTSSDPLFPAGSPFPPLSSLRSPSGGGGGIWGDISGALSGAASWLSGMQPIVGASIPGGIAGFNPLTGKFASNFGLPIPIPGAPANFMLPQVGGSGGTKSEAAGAGTTGLPSGWQAYLKSLQTPDRAVATTGGPAAGGYAKGVSAIAAAANAPVKGVGYQPVAAQQIPVPATTDYTATLAGLAKAITGGEGRSLTDYLPLAAQLEATYGGGANALRALISQGANALNTIGTYNRGAIQALHQVPGQISNDYNQAMSVQGAVSRGAQQALMAANPQQAESSLGIDPAQAARMAGQNNMSFNQAGNVLGGVGMLGVGDLAAQKANELAYARELPALIAQSGAQQLTASQLGTQSNLAKLEAAQGATVEKMAAGMEASNQKNTALNASLYTHILTQQTAEQRLQQEALSSNAKAIQSAASTNASNYARSIQEGISMRNANISRAKFNLAAWKAMNPTAPGAQSATAAKSTDEFFKGRFALGKPTSWQSVVVRDKNGNPAINPSTGKVMTTKNPVYSDRTTYDQAVDQYATTHGVTTDQAKLFANNYVNVGYGGDTGGGDMAYDESSRPFDPTMLPALKNATGLQGGSGFAPTWLPTVAGRKINAPALSLSQVTALNNGGFRKWVIGNTHRTTLPGVGMVFVIRKIKA